MQQQTIRSMVVLLARRARDTRLLVFVARKQGRKNPVWTPVGARVVRGAWRARRLEISSEDISGRERQCEGKSP